MTATRTYVVTSLLPCIRPMYWHNWTSASFWTRSVTLGCLKWCGLIGLAIGTEPGPVVYTTKPRILFWIENILSPRDWLLNFVINIKMLGMKVINIVSYSSFFFIFLNLNLSLFSFAMIFHVLGMLSISSKRSN